jgi:glutamate 5-kinase
VTEITEDTYRIASGEGSRRGRGGMITKLNAASFATNAGIDMVITDSNHPEYLYEILKGVAVGTLFTGKNKTV